MLRNDRDDDQNFDPDEFLYMRWGKADLTDDDRVRPENIRCPDQSVNREKHNGRDWFVLLPDPEHPKSPAWLCMGVLRFRVSNVPKPIEHAGSEHTFSVVHDPTDRNFHHCELRAFKDGRRNPKKVAREAKKHFRTALGLAVELVIAPNEQHDESAASNKQ